MRHRPDQYSALSVPHRCSKARSIFLQAVDPRCVEFLERWTQDGLQPEVANKVKEWFSVRTNGRLHVEGLGDWDISGTRRISG
jgi:methionyl-tRNA synthetase